VINTMIHYLNMVKDRQVSKPTRQMTESMLFKNDMKLLGETKCFRSLLQLIQLLDLHGLHKLQNLTSESE
jgi:hypothetical protein